MEAARFVLNHSRGLQGIRSLCWIASESRYREPLPNMPTVRYYAQARSAPHTAYHFCFSKYATNDASSSKLSALAKPSGIIE